MRVFDSTLTTELFEYDETRGRFDEGELITVVPEHIDEDGNIVYEHEESERVKLYYPYSDDTLKQLGLYEYSEEELAQIARTQQLEELYHRLAVLDAKALEFIDGYITEEEYSAIRTERNEIRDQIDTLTNN